MAKGKTFIDINLAEDWQGPARTKRIRIEDVARYYAHEVRSMSGCRTIAGISGDWRPMSGCRTIAGIVGDWRLIDYVASDCLAYFKAVNIEGMRKAGRKFGLEPRF